MGRGMDKYTGGTVIDWVLVDSFHWAFSRYPTSAIPSNQFI